MTLYDVLQVQHSASPDEIKTAFRRLAALYHPDKPTGDAVKFRQARDAYEVLIEPERRKAYDAGGMPAVNQQPADPRDFIHQMIQRTLQKTNGRPEAFFEAIGTAVYAGVVAAINAPLPVTSVNENDELVPDYATLLQTVCDLCDLQMEGNRNMRIANKIPLDCDLSEEDKQQRQRKK